VAAGGELTLLGIDTVQIRDTAEVPFIGFAGGDLLVQGNEQVDIVALRHPDSGLSSYGDMVLRSANPVGGDAHYWSGGNFRVETVDGEVGALFSPVDPIIRAFGDVEIEGYLGSSLHILAGGSVTIGTAIINAPDAGELGIDFLQETITLSDATFVEIDGGVQPTLDVRAGVASEALGASPFDLLTGFSNNTLDTLQGNALPTSESLSADITVANIVIRSPNGLVILTNQYQPNLEFPNGDISIDGRGAFEDGIDVRVFDGRGGDVFLDSRGSILSSGNILTSSNTGSSGNVKLLSQGETVFLGGAVLTRLFGVGEAGSIEVRSNSFTLANGGQLSANTLGNGPGGDIEISVAGSILIEGENQFGNSSGIFTAVEETAIGDGGDIRIQTSSLTLRDAGTISSSSVGNGSAGDIRINAQDVEVLNGAQMLSITEGIGHAGNVFITARDRVLFDGIGQFSSAALSRVNRGAVGTGGNVEIITNTLEVLNGAQLGATTQGDGNAGSVIINAREQVLLQGSNVAELSDGTTDQLNSSISTFSEDIATGGGDDILITTPLLVVKDEAFIEAGTLNTQPGGDVVLTLGRLDVLNGGQVSTRSEGSGPAGTIRVDATEGIQVSGSALNVPSQATQMSSTIESQDVLSSLSVRSSADGPAGNIVIGAAGTTPEIVLDDGGQIIAESATVDGGNITLNLTDLLLLRNGSLISASAGTEQAGGNGGNIIITVPFIVAIPTENSDIAADAFEGIGGNVTINASGVFGIEPRPNRTPLSDITASSELGVSGLVNLNVLDTGFIENNLSSFEDTIIDTSTLTAGSCIARTADDQGSFVVTGRDGIPPRPGDIGIAAYPTGTVQTIESGGASLPRMHPTGTLQEPDGVYQLPDGRLVLSRECD
jgi:large exoprotein involved in heme utilization and adhesion